MHTKVTEPDHNNVKSAEVPQTEAATGSMVSQVRGNAVHNELVSKVIGFTALALCLVWAYWTTIQELWRRWSDQPQYSHGYFVPIFAGVLLWWRRDMLESKTLRGSWWGLPVLVFGVAMRLAGAYYFYDTFDFLSLLPVFVGICLLLGGWYALWWSWPAILFLIFMIPMPFRLETAMAQPLQQIATRISTYTLQTLGLPAIAEGNTILIEEARIGVVEACSGLRMLTVFIALAMGFIFMIDRPIWERAILLASAIPIALISNIVRITVTGAMHSMGLSKAADVFFHDVAGWFMMPLAVALLALELWLLSKVFIVVKPVAPLPLGPLDADETQTKRVRNANGSTFPNSHQTPRQNESTK
jgi:exosortase